MLAPALLPVAAERWIKSGPALTRSQHIMGQVVRGAVQRMEWLAMSKVAQVQSDHCESIFDMKHSFSR